MRVICIDASNPMEPLKLRDEDKIIEGNYYNVIKEVENENGIFYSLFEKLKNSRRVVLYQSRRFIPCGIEIEGIDYKAEELDDTKIWED